MHIVAIMTHFHCGVAALTGVFGDVCRFLQRPKLGNVDLPGLRLQTYRVLGRSFINGNKTVRYRIHGLSPIPGVHSLRDLSNSFPWP